MRILCVSSTWPSSGSKPANLSQARQVRDEFFESVLNLSFAMASTPKTPRSTRNARSSTASTPGGASVDSAGNSGLPWNVQKALAAEIEKAFPFYDLPTRGDTKNSTHALYNSGTQALDKLLNKLVADNPEENLPLHGKRGDKKRRQISDLCQHWRSKERENCCVAVCQRFSVKHTRTDKLPKTPKEDDASASDSSVEEEFELDEIASPSPRPTEMPKKATPKRKDTLVGSTVSAALKMGDTNPNNRFVMLSDGTLQGACLFLKHSHIGAAHAICSLSLPPFFFRDSLC